MVLTRSNRFTDIDCIFHYAERGLEGGGGGGGEWTFLFGPPSPLFFDLSPLPRPPGAPGTIHNSHWPELLVAPSAVVGRRQRSQPPSGKKAALALLQPALFKLASKKRLLRGAVNLSLHLVVL